MASPKQIEANRANALRSTGPRTEAGKAVSSGNAVRHGLRARRVVIEGEDPDVFDQLQADILAEFDPATPAEVLLIEQLAATMWRLRRVPQFEAGLLDWIAHVEREKQDALSEVSFPFGASGALHSPGDGPEADGRRIGRMIVAALSRGDLMSKLSRYEAQLMKQLERTLAQFERLMRQRLEAAAVIEPQAVEP